MLPSGGSKSRVRAPPNPPRDRRSAGDRPGGRPPGQAMLIYVDADACPVKEEVYRVAGRYQVGVIVVSNSSIRVPARPGIEAVVVRGGARRGGRLDRRADRGRRHRDHRRHPPGRPLPAQGGPPRSAPGGTPSPRTRSARPLATRELLDTLRQSGYAGGGPPPFVDKDRSRFLSRLDDLIQAARRRRPPGDLTGPPVAGGLLISTDSATSGRRRGNLRPPALHEDGRGRTKPRGAEAMSRTTGSTMLRQFRTLFEAGDGGGPERWPTARTVPGRARRGGGVGLRRAGGAARADGPGASAGGP